MGSGDSYEGQWERDLIHGKVRAVLSVRLLAVDCTLTCIHTARALPQGRYIYADGSVYEGEYKEAERTQARAECAGVAAE